MQIGRLKIKDFRNLKDFEIHFTEVVPAMATLESGPSARLVAIRMERPF